MLILLAQRVRLRQLQLRGIAAVLVRFVEPGGGLFRLLLLEMV